MLRLLGPREGGEGVEESQESVEISLLALEHGSPPKETSSKAPKPGNIVSIGGDESASATTGTDDKRPNTGIRKYVAACTYLSTERGISGPASGTDR